MTENQLMKERKGVQLNQKELVKEPVYQCDDCALMKPGSCPSGTIWHAIGDVRKLSPLEHRLFVAQTKKAG